MPQLFQSAESVLDDTAVKVEVSREAIGFDKEVSVNVLISNTVDRWVMPLLKGKKNIGHNISEMEKSGHPKNQSIAAALNEARESGAKIPKKKKKWPY